MVRVVLDTNVRYSAIGFAGLPRDVVRFCRQANCVQVISPALLQELRETLLRRYTVSAVEAAIPDVNSALIVVPKTSLEVCRDPDDNRVLECAIAGQAGIIVTGDKDLLALNPFRGIRILTPRQFYGEFIAPSTSHPLP